MNTTKRNLRKRLLSALTVAALCLCMCLNVFADDDTLEYVALGDSITYGYGLVDADTEGLVTLFAESIGATSTLNGGISGLTASYLLSALDGSMETSSATAFLVASIKTALTTADVVTITIGGNDLLAAFYTILGELADESGIDLDGTSVQMALADPSTDPAIIAEIFNMLNDDDLSSYLLSSDTFTDAVTTCVADINSIAAEIKSINPDAVILLANQYNPYQWLEGGENISALFEAGVTYFNAALASGKTNDYTVVDVFSAFYASSDSLTNAYLTLDTTTGLPTDYNFDFHPNAAGHAVIADTLASAYTAILNGESPESGDNANVMLLISLMMIGAVGCFATVRHE